MFFLRGETGKYLLKEKISTYLMKITAQNIFLEVTWCSRWRSNCLPQLIVTASNIMGLNTRKVVVVSKHKCFQWCSSVYNGAYCSYLVKWGEMKLFIYDDNNHNMRMKASHHMKFNLYINAPLEFLLGSLFIYIFIMSI